MNKLYKYLLLVLSFLWISVLANQYVMPEKWAYEWWGIPFAITWFASLIVGMNIIETPKDKQHAAA